MKIFFEITDFKKFLDSESGRILALDIGTKRIGVAICDETRSIMTPKLILNRQNNQKDFEKIAKIIFDSKVIGLVVGLPFNLDGSSTQMTEFVLRFADNFVKFWQNSHKNKMPLILWDERLSSFEARDLISKIPKKKKFYDDIAANVILEHLLNDLRNCKD